MTDLATLTAILYAARPKRPDLSVGILSLEHGVAGALRSFNEVRTLVRNASAGHHTCFCRKGNGNIA
jgi:hypothetical protein